MFMKAVYYFIFINLVLLSSCGSQRSKGDIQKLVPNIFLSDDALNCPYYMCVTDKYFILGNVKGDTILDVFSLGGKRLNQFLFRGEGPNEVLHMMGIQYSSVDSCIYIPDASRHLMYRILEQELENDNPFISTVFYYNPEKLPDESAIRDWWRYMSNDKLFAACASPKGMLSYFDKNMSDISFYENYPDKDKVNESLSEWAHIGLYQSCSAVSPNANNLIMAYYGSDILGFVRLHGDDVSVNFQRKKLPNDIYVAQLGNGNMQGAYTGESMRYYVCATASDESVYILYNGKKNKDCVPGVTRGSIVKCYKWSGEWIRDLDLGKDMLQIVVSPDDKVLFALESSEDGYLVLRYEL